MPANGSKVGVREFYAELQKQSSERQDMELRLVNAFASGLSGIRDDMAEERKANETRFKCVEGDVVDLRVADRRWTGLASLFGAGLGAVAGWFSSR